MDLKESSLKKSENRHPWELARFEIVRGLLDSQLKELQNRQGVVLDLGCGDTWFIEKMSGLYPGIQFLAVDIAFTEEQLTELRGKYHEGPISVYKTLEEAGQNLNREVDVLLLLDVIEHIENDIEFLKWVQTFPFITEKTIFSITVPAYQWLFSSHDIFLDHYRRYTNEMLIRHIRDSGLIHSKVGYFFFSLYLARIAVWLKEKLSGKKEMTTGLVEWTGGKGITGFIKNVLLTDYRISRFLRTVGIKIPGLSNYILCRKSA